MHKPHRRKITHEYFSEPNDGIDVDTSKPTAVFTPRGGRSYTLSVALPGSIIAKYALKEISKRNLPDTNSLNSAQSHDQKTFLAGSIARALAVFCVDEVVIFEDEVRQRQSNAHCDLSKDEYTAYSNPSHFLAHVLSYLETPPHLRKFLFPMHKNLRTAGTLPSLDMPHHIRANELCEYREGVTFPANEEHGFGQSNAENHNNQHKRKKGKKNMEEGAQDTVMSYTLVDTGLPNKVRIPHIPVPENTRVTVKLCSSKDPSQVAEVVSPSAPREEMGYYWGYSVRCCDSLSDVFTECPFDGGYDLSFGTSERGSPLSQVITEGVPNFEHLIVVFGGVAGLEVAVKADKELLARGLRPETVGNMFDYWVNVLPGQGSRTIRTEEAVWLGLMGLRGVVEKNGS
ncbi:deoxyribose-phosphate aldolase [Paracoccidioides lutzii Pb01]|uniref:Deoxyribose-phosphate aldolase n=1 Tax=Paracoccidioides lutzii (strain ATCC MYA-826 / Pb01) TaxID=502779 RepID=C1H598_PARBA|nr:deoxyribose-phosphate aldolase [Paracoccidioides lutzii Pb01]EEH34892.1 deoxyribose-phosphate aldolase [Paracoccidioides lutzii Pb01]